MEIEILYYMKWKMVMEKLNNIIGMVHLNLKENIWIFYKLSFFIFAVAAATPLPNKVVPELIAKAPLV